MATFHVSSIGENTDANLATASAAAAATVGPASAVDGNLAVFSGTTGKLLKDGGSPSAIVVVFPDSDPHVAGAGYWTDGVLTKSAG